MATNLKGKMGIAPIGVTAARSPHSPISPRILKEKDIQRKTAAVSLCILGVSASILAACGPSVIAGNEQKSPDGKLVAKVRNELAGPGFGSEWAQTIVEIQGDHLRSMPTTVLLLTHEYSTIPISLKWDSPNRLHIIYGQNAKPDDHVVVEFQVVKWANVDVRVTDLSPASKGQ